MLATPTPARASNHRLLDCEHGQVRYRYRDRLDSDRAKIDVLPAWEFLRRFLQHAYFWPKGPIVR